MEKKVHKADFEVEINGITAGFIRPTFTVWKFAVAAMEKGGAIAFKNALVRNCCIDKNSELLSDAYIQDVVAVVTDLIEYEKAIVEKDENCWKITIGQASCRLKSISIEAQVIAERDNAKSEPFKTKQNLLKLLWIDGDERIKSEKHPELLIPAIGIIDELRERHIATIKKL